MVQLHLIFAIRWLLFITCYLWLAIWIFLSETCYYLQKLAPFARCCTSRNFSFSVLGILSSLKVFQWCFKKVLRVFEFSRMFPVSLKGVYKKFQGYFKGISIKFWGCFKLVYREFQVISWGFQGYLKEV